MRARELLDRAGRRNPLPAGTLSVGGGLMIAGLTAYGFLVISARALGPERYAPLSVLWALVFLAGPGFFLPIEQEVARALSSRRALQLGGGPVVRRAALAGGGILAGLVVAAGAGAGPLLDRLLDDDVLLLVGLLLALVGYWLEHLARGTLSGNGRFRPYGVVIGTEGTARLLICVALAAGGVATAGPYGLAMGLAPFVAVAVGLRGQRGLVSPGPDAAWSEVSRALGWLLGGSILAQLLINAGPLAVKLLAAPDQQAQAGRFLAGLVIARIPLFLFQAVQASLIPALSGLAAAGRRREFVERFSRLLAAVAAVAALATVVAFAIGPDVVRILFGPAYELGRRDLGLLAAASGTYVVALSLAQALIALAGYRPVVAAWAAGVAGFVAGVVMLEPLLLRVEIGFLVGSAAAAAAMGGLLTSRVRRMPWSGIS